MGDKCLHEELWSDIDESDLSDWSVEDSEEDWEPQPGEDWTERDYKVVSHGQDGHGGDGSEQEPAAEPAPGSKGTLERKMSFSDAVSMTMGNTLSVKSERDSTTMS